MRAKWRGGALLVVGSLLMAPSGFVTSAHAQNAPFKHHHHSYAADRSAHANSKHPLSKSGKARYARSGGSVLQCVPFARAASGIALKGNAANWWDAAAGVYQRGEVPEPGSVLNFRANGHMRLGHVAVVTAVISSREIEIDHANWSAFGASKGDVSRGIHVLDVSANNDWSAVRVELGHSEDFGSVYPTYGFIYDRPDNGTMMASRHAPDDDDATPTEVAEAPVPVHPHARNGATRGAAAHDAHVIRVSYHEVHAPERENEHQHATPSRHGENLRPLVHHIRFN